MRIFDDSDFHPSHVLWSVGWTFRESRKWNNLQRRESEVHFMLSLLSHSSFVAIISAIKRHERSWKGKAATYPGIQWNFPALSVSSNCNWSSSAPFWIYRSVHPSQTAPGLSFGILSTSSLPLFPPCNFCNFCFPSNTEINMKNRDMTTTCGVRRWGGG